MQSPDSQIIVGRFFEALNHLIATKKIRGKQTFTREFGIDRWNLSKLDKDRTRDIFQPAWLFYLTRYGVSAEWLLTGKGEIMKPATKRSRATAPAEVAKRDLSRAE